MEGSDSQVSYVHFNVSPTFIFNLQSFKSILEGANSLFCSSVDTQLYHCKQRDRDRGEAAPLRMNNPDSLSG